MAKEVSTTGIEVSDELPEDEQQRGMGDSSISAAKHYQNLLEQDQRCASPQYQEILPCKRSHTVSLHTLKED